MENSNPLPRGPLKRAITVLLEQIPSLGIIERSEFTTPLGAGCTFTRWRGEGKPPGFWLELKASHYWTAEELRQFASECGKMAKYLEELNQPKRKTS